MEQPSAASANSQPTAGLPPVVPPSGRHIVQLFVVPGGIVLGVVVLFLGCSGLLNLLFGTGFSRTTHDFLTGLENSNPEVRWRTASDLAQVLKRDDTLAADPELGLKLSELLGKAIDELNRDSKSFNDRQANLSAKERATEQESLRNQRSYIQFLSACLGNMSLPVGAPAVTRLATNKKGPDAKTLALLRRHAVWVLANMGENRKRFQALPAAKREAVLAKLQEEANANSGPRSDLARQTLAWMENKSHPDVIRPLAECADDQEDPFLRQMVAFALTFWEGTPEENALADKALAKLARDNGQGEVLEINEGD